MTGVINAVMLRVAAWLRWIADLLAGWAGEGERTSSLDGSEHLALRAEVAEFLARLQAAGLLPAGMDGTRGEGRRQAPERGVAQELMMAEARVLEQRRTGAPAHWLRDLERIEAEGAERIEKGGLGAESGEEGGGVEVERERQKSRLRTDEKVAAGVDGAVAGGDLDLPGLESHLPKRDPKTIEGRLAPLQVGEDRHGGRAMGEEVEGAGVPKSPSGIEARPRGPREGWGGRQPEGAPEAGARAEMFPDERRDGAWLEDIGEAVRVGIRGVQAQAGPKRRVRLLPPSEQTMKRLLQGADLEDSPAALVPREGGAQITEGPPMMRLRDSSGGEIAFGESPTPAVPEGRLHDTLRESRKRPADETKSEGEQDGGVKRVPEPEKRAQRSEDVAGLVGNGRQVPDSSHWPEIPPVLDATGDYSLRVLKLRAEGSSWPVLRENHWTNIARLKERSGEDRDRRRQEWKKRLEREQLG